MTVTAQERIMAGITVYDVVDGREVNRRHAFPLTRMKVTLNDITDGPMARLAKSIEKMHEAFVRLCVVDPVDVP